jgi:hypothetical protein
MLTIWYGLTGPELRRSVWSEFTVSIVALPENRSNPLKIDAAIVPNRPKSTKIVKNTQYHPKLPLAKRKRHSNAHPSMG